MATINQCAGFEIPDVNAYGSPNGTAPTSSALQARTKGSGAAAGSRSLRCAGNAALSYVLAVSSANQFGWSAVSRSAIRIAFYVAQVNTSGTMGLFAFGTGGNLATLKLTSAGSLQMVCAGGTAVTYGTISTGQWYTVEFEYDTSVASNWVVHWRVNNVVQTDAVYTGSATTPTHGQMHFGNSVSSAVGSYEFYLDDFALSATAGDYPIGNGYVIPYGVSASGSHSITTGAFQDDGGNAITAGETTSYTKLTEATPDTTSYVQQTTQASTNYLEYALANTGSPSDTPRYVRASLYSATGGGGASGAGKLHDGTTDSTIPTSNSATYGFREASLSTRAGAQGAWTTAAIDALTFRIGFRSSVTANTAVRASWMALEVEYADSYSTVDSGSVTVVAVISGAEALTDSGTITATAAISGAEAFTDSGSLTALVVLSADELVVSTDTSSVTATETDSGTEALTDAGTVTTAVATSGAEALADLSSLTAIEADSGSDALADTAAMTAVVALSALDALTDTGSLTAIVVLSADAVYDTVIDSGSVVAVQVPGGLEAIADQGSETGVVVIVAADALSDGAVTATSNVLSGLEALADAGSLAALVVLTRAEKLVDLGSFTAIETDSALHQSLEDGSLVVVSTATGSDEALADEATVVSLADFFGSGGHVRLIKGYARTAFTRENADTVTLSGTGAAVSLGPQRTYGGVTGGGTSGGGG